MLPQYVLDYSELIPTAVFKSKLIRKTTVLVTKHYFILCLSKKNITATIKVITNLCSQRKEMTTTIHLYVQSILTYSLAGGETLINNFGIKIKQG